MSQPISARTLAAYAFAAVVAGAPLAGPSRAETLLSALALAYQTNPQLNAQRAALRATDETVPQALSGYRPRVSINSNFGAEYTSATTRVGTGAGAVAVGVGTGTGAVGGTTGTVGTVGTTATTTGTTAGVATTSSGGGTSSATFYPTTIGVTATQILFNGFQTANRTRAAESQVSSAREGLRLLEQQVLLDAATAYMNVLRDTAIEELQRRNVEVLQEQLRQTRDRFAVGEVTRTDVAQAESRLAAAQSTSLASTSNVATSRANYQRIIGVAPTALAPAAPVDRLSPSTLAASIARGVAENPQVAAQMYGIDVALLQVKINEGVLYPTVTVQASAQQNFNSTPVTTQSFIASVFGGVTVPVYQGGGEYSLIRQSKENLGQQRLNLAAIRDQVRATVAQAWGVLLAARAQIQAAQSQVTAAEIALNGVREEARVGQRTTLDVLNSQQELVNARVSLVTAQRDRVVASYSLLFATGGLDAGRLGLRTPVYDPIIHYTQIRDAWAGVRTPTGR